MRFAIRRGSAGETSSNPVAPSRLSCRQGLTADACVERHHEALRVVQQLQETRAMQVTISLPDLERIPHPSLSSKQWAVVGGAAVLGVTNLLSAPVALAVGAAPFVDRYLLHDGTAATSKGSNRASTTTVTARSTRRTSAASRTAGGTASASRTGRRPMETSRRRRGRAGSSTARTTR